MIVVELVKFFFASRRRHTRLVSDWSSDVCSSDLRQTGDHALTVMTLAALDRNQQMRRGGEGKLEWLRIRHLDDFAGERAPGAALPPREIGRASCRERGESSGGSVAVRKNRGEAVC